MKFTAKPLKDNVNVSKNHPLKELFWLTGGLFLVVGLLFFSLGFFADWAVTKTSPDIENWLGEKALKQFPAKPNGKLQARLGTIVGNLPHHSPLHEYRFTAYLGDKDVINAIALPGGNIIVYSGLLKQVESENELTMILAHELGHFAHRDHLKGLGRGLSLAVAATLLFGYDNPASDIISNTFLTYQAKYSQTQEEDADLFGLDLLVQTYGHAGGATAFFERIAKHAGSRGSYFLASHPHPELRIQELQARIAEQGYAVEPVQPLSFEP